MSGYNYLTFENTWIVARTQNSQSSLMIGLMCFDMGED